MSRLLPVVCLLALAGCAEPPSREMGLAQTAIDAARAAGAEQHAASELTAALGALARSEQAVTEKDYRLALSFAMDSRAQAESAIKLAGAARAAAQRDASKAIAAAATLLARAEARLKDPAIARLPPRTTQPYAAAITDSAKRMQEARAAFGVGDYAGAVTHAEEASTRIGAALVGLDEAALAAAKRRRR
ncbi:MAG: DUF4398 domain-containing protein [Acidobacteriota bacterium]